MTTIQDEAPATALPDLRDIPEDQLARLGDTALGTAIRLARERLEAGNPPAPFNSGI